MWRRQNNQPVMAYDNDMDDAYDDRYLETIHEVESIRSRPVSMATALPELPLYVNPNSCSVPAEAEAELSLPTNIPLVEQSPP
jgi:hypothetical protein